MEIKDSLIEKVFTKEEIQSNRELIQGGVSYLRSLFVDETDETKKLTEEEMKQFLILCKVYNLNPLKREIYAVKYNKQFNVITNYYEYVKRAEATGLIEYYYVDIELNENNWPIKATFYGKRKDWTKEHKSVFIFKEWTTGKSTWLSKPCFMIEKVALANGLRRLFPNELANMPYIKEEYWNEFNFKQADENLNKAQQKALESKKEALESVLEANIISKNADGGLNNE